MLKTILAISGKPGLFKLVSRGKGNLIVETLDAQRRRMPAFGTDKIISLADIAMYTEEEEVPLRQVMSNIAKAYDTKALPFDIKQATKEELTDFMATALPDYDRDRVRISDMKKLAQWYNILVTNGVTAFDEDLQETQGDNISDR